MNLNELKEFFSEHDKSQLWGDIVEEFSKELYLENEFKHGINYGDLEDLIQCYLLNFCGCGAPWRNLEYIHGALKSLQKFRNKDFTFDEYKALAEIHFGPTKQ